MSARGAGASSAPTGKPFLVVSDVHIGAVPASTERELRAFLDYAAEHAAGLVINGDLFDVWVPSRNFVLRPYVRTLAKLADLIDRGLPVYFVGGNHDALEYIGPVLRDDMGVLVLDDPVRLTLGHHRALVTHGDGVRRGQATIRKENAPLLAILRTRLGRRVAARLAAPGRVDGFYRRVSRVSRAPEFVARHARGESTGPKPAAPLIEAWARDRLRDEPELDVVLAGHSHLPAWIEVDPGRYYVNTGDWISHMTYGVLPPGGGPPEVRRWPDRARVLPGP
jgi:UDP-2,3-diacylglucosamine hydrolase